MGLLSPALSSNLEERELGLRGHGFHHWWRTQSMKILLDNISG